MEPKALCSRTPWKLAIRKSKPSRYEPKWHPPSVRACTFFAGKKAPAVMVKIGSWVHGTIAHDWAGALTSYSLVNRV